MTRLRPYFIQLLLSAAMVVPALTLGCGGGTHYYRAYDADHGDYHTWNSNETVYYQQWETGNHYDHKDFKARSKDEQKQYFDWRHKNKDDKDKH
jgi:hypothetical protein